MKYTQKSNKDQTVVYDVTLTKQEIEDQYKKSLEQLAKTAKVEGFREGKAPAHMAEKAIGKEKIYDDVIQNLMGDVYSDILKKDKIEPVLAPKVDLVDAKENEDWNLTITFALQPKISLPDYKKIAKDVRGDMKKDDIWVPGKDDDAQGTKDVKGADNLDAKALEQKEKFLNAFLEKLIDETKIEMSELIIEQEMNSRLARLVDDVRKIGLSIDAYFQSRNTTEEEVKKSFRDDIMKTYKLEFALNEIGDKEEISVDQKEIEMLIGSIDDEKGREQAQQNAYYYATMLRKQKILDFVGSL